MQSVGTKTLDTPRLLLRRFTLNDIEPFFRNMASDATALRFLNWSPHKNTYVTKNCIERYISDYESPDSYVWCIELKESAEAIGAILVSRLDKTHESARIGYYIGSNFFGNGYMTEALREVIRFLFDAVGLLYVECEYDLNNPASGRVMEKCGMSYVRTRRKSSVNNS